MGRRVVITGIGVISPIGVGTEAFWSNCLLDKTAQAPIPDAWHRYSKLHSRVWAPLPTTPDVPEFIGRIEAKQLDPVSKNALWAAFSAVADAGFTSILTDEKKLLYRLTGLTPERTGVFMGTGIGGIFTVGTSYAHQICDIQTERIESLRKSDSGQIPQVADAAAKMMEGLVFPKRFNPFTVSMLMPNAPSANMAIKLGIQGPCRTYCMACASGTTAVGHAFRAVLSGEVDVALTGGSEYLYDDYGAIFRAFDELRTLAHGFEPEALSNRPFDSKRSGFLFSQGASAVLVIESLEHAQKRNAEPIAEVAAYAETCDASSIMMMDHSGVQIERMLTSLFQDAKMSPHQVDYINAHGTGTELNDSVEASVIGRMFRKDAAVNSTKALIGHTMGASGAVEAAVTALSLKHQALHGNPNLDDPIAPLNFIRRGGPQALDTAVSQSFAFGGHNAGLLFKRFKADA